MRNLRNNRKMHFECSYDAPLINQFLRHHIFVHVLVTPNASMVQHHVEQTAVVGGHTICEAFVTHETIRGFSPQVACSDSISIHTHV